MLHKNVPKAHHQEQEQCKKRRPRDHKKKKNSYSLVTNVDNISDFYYNKWFNICCIIYILSYSSCINEFSDDLANAEVYKENTKYYLY